MMLEQTLQYHMIRDDVGFLRLKRRYHHLFHWKAAFYAHVFSSIFCLLAAFTQFAPIRTRTLALIHRWSGRAYVFIILLVAAPSGVVLACYAEGGIIGRIGFLTLALLWFTTTAMGLIAIRKRKIQSHLEWMTRSYALVFSAITLRLWQHWLDVLLPAHIDLHPITAWLSWIPNLLLAEILIRLVSRRRLKTAKGQQNDARSSGVMPL